MLVLARKRLQRIHIDGPGGRITLVVLGNSSQGDSRIGIEAPQDYRIRRGELEKLDSDQCDG